MNVLVIGDSCEDVFIYGNITRLAPEAPVPVIVPMRQKSNLGMAGNVYNNLKSLGVLSDLITNKDIIRKVRYVDESYNQMVLRVDENDNCSRYDGDVFVQDKYDALIISDYNKGFLTEEDIAKWSKVANCPVFLDTKKILGPWCTDVDFIKINNTEYERNLSVIRNDTSLKDKLIITKGKYGCEYKGIVYPTREVSVRDVSGAGDTFIAGLVCQYIKNNNILQSIEFAQECTTEVVQKSGVATL